MAVSSFSNSGIKSGSKRNKIWDQSAVENSFFSIDTQTVGAGGAANIEFTNIPQTYTHLQLRGIARFTGASVETNMRIQFNNDTSSVYTNHLVIGNGSSAGSGNDINIAYSIINSSPNGNATASIFSANIIDILDYTNTNKFKTMKNLTGWDHNGGINNSVGLWSGLWRSTNAITSIKLTPGSGNFAQYSSFALYGIKG